MRLTRIIGALDHLAGVLVGIAIGILALGLALLANWEAVRLFGLTFETGAPRGLAHWLPVALGVLACATVGAAAPRLRDILRLDVSPPRGGSSGAWSGVARAYGLPRGILGLLLAAVAVALSGLVTVNLMRGNAIAISLRVLVVLALGAVTLWLFLRPPRALTVFGRSLDRALRRGQPTYTLTPEGVAIDLRRRRAGQAGSAPVLLRYDELLEVRPLSYAGARAYVRYQVGPNVDLAVRQTRDVARYLKGEIPRPGVYAMGVPTAAGRHVLLRGPELFYLVAFDCDDVADLVSAYAASITRESPPA